MNEEAPHSSIDLGDGAWVARGDLRWSFSRSSGPGGQNVNKVNTRAELRVEVGAIRNMHPAAQERLRRLAAGRLVGEEIVFVADETRSQVDNREACVDRLRELVARASVIPKTRRKTRPTRGSKERRLDGKKREGDKKRGRGWREE